MKNLLERAKNGFELTRKMPPIQRADILRRTAELLYKRKEEFAKLICSEVFKPIKQARFEIEKTIDILNLTAEEALRINGEVIPISRSFSEENKFASFLYEPLGVVLAISPYNFPIGTLTHKIAPALAAGNSVILKPSPKAINCAEKFSSLFFEAGLPKDALNLINCPDETTQALAASPEINFINFTGSSSVGWKLRSIAAPGVKCILELGGNAPVIIHRDADINSAVSACVRGAFSFAGQSCISVQRVYLHKDIKNKFTEDLLEAISGLKVGDPELEETDIGPMINESSLERINAWVEEAVSMGAEILSGGKKSKNFRQCYEPTVLNLPLSGNSRSCEIKILSEEAFAPILILCDYEDINDAIKQANSTRFGLSTGIFTQDLDLAFYVSDELKFGTVLINDGATFRADEMPIGAQKHSGYGLEGPRHAIREMSATKVKIFNLKKI